MLGARVDDTHQKHRGPVHSQMIDAWNECAIARRGARDVENTYDPAERIDDVLSVGGASRHSKQNHEEDRDNTKSKGGFLLLCQTGLFFPC